MSDYVPCDGCPEEATHHLCEECCNEPTGEYARGVADGERLLAVVVREWMRSDKGFMALTEILDRYEHGEST